MSKTKGGHFHGGSLAWYLDAAPPTADPKDVYQAWRDSADPEEVWP